MVALLIFVVAEFLHVGALENGPTSQPVEKTEKSTAVQPANAANANAVRLDVEVVLTQSTIRPREPVTGTLKFTNSGKQVISIRPTEFPRAFARGLNGAEATSFRPRIFVCGGTGFSSSAPLEFKPGVTVEHRFDILTDPMSDLAGTTLTDGQFEISFPDLMESHKIPTFVKPALLTVKSDLAPRLVRFGVGGRRLVAIYEGGLVQVLDIDRRSVIREFTIPDYSIPESWEKRDLVSPDGKYLALIRRGPDRLNSGGQLIICDLDQEHPNDSILSVPATGVSNDWPWMHPWLLGFSSDGKHLNVGSTMRLCQIDVATGSMLQNASVIQPSTVSPDGRFYVETNRSNKHVIYQIENRRWNNPLKGPGRAETLHWGRRGLYVGWSDKPGLVLYDEEGEPKLRIPCRGQEIVAESPDGGYLAIEESQAGLGQDLGEVEIWDVETNSRKDTIATSSGFVSLSANPVAAVVGSSKGRLPNGFAIFSSVFKVRSIEGPSSVRRLRIPAPRAGK